MNPIRTAWFVVNGPPLMAISLLGLVSSLVGFDWLDNKCVGWFNEINATRP
jgi:hypothetical protein